VEKECLHPVSPVTNGPFWGQSSSLGASENLTHEWRTMLKLLRHFVLIHLLSDVKASFELLSGLPKRPF
jgi:hypothetical protein